MEKFCEFLVKLVDIILANDMEFRIMLKLSKLLIIFADNLDYFNVKKLINIYGNINGQSLDGNFTADI